MNDELGISVVIVLLVLMLVVLAALAVLAHQLKLKGGASHKGQIRLVVDIGSEHGRLVAFGVDADAEMEETVVMLVVGELKEILTGKVSGVRLLGSPDVTKLVLEGLSEDERSRLEVLDPQAA